MWSSDERLVGSPIVSQPDAFFVLNLELGPAILALPDLFVQCIFSKWHNNQCALRS